MYAETLIIKTEAVQFTAEARAGLEQEGLANIQRALDLAVNTSSFVDPRVYGYLRQAAPDLADHIPSGEDDESRESLWRRWGRNRTSPSAAALRALESVGTDTPDAQALEQALQILTMGDALKQSQEGITPAMMFALLGKTAHVSHQDPVPYLQQALDLASQDTGLVEGEVALNFTHLGRTLDETGYDATDALTRALDEADAIVVAEGADQFSPGSQVIVYEAVVGAAVDGGYFGVATEAINRLKAVNEMMGTTFCDGAIVESYAYLGVAQRAAAQVDVN